MPNAAVITEPLVDVLVNPVPATVTEPDDPFTCWTYEVGTAEIEAVIVPLLNPNETLFEFAKVIPPKAPELAPAYTLRGTAATVFADIVTDIPAAFVDPESVILLPPAKTN